MTMSAQPNDAENEVNETVEPYPVPPPEAFIPQAPKGFIPTHGTDYVGLLPNEIELAVLAEAIGEITTSPDIGAILGWTVPDPETIAQILGTAEKWSTMLAQSRECDLYCRTQAGLASKRERERERERSCRG
jgi:hypothetical protein